MIAYHIDNEQQLSLDSELKFYPIKPFPEFQTLIDKFDNKFTHFGNFYTRDIILEQGSPSYMFDIYNNTSIELTFELFRAAYYPKEPSRLSSVFFTDFNNLQYWTDKLRKDKEPNILIADIPESKPFDEYFLKSKIGQTFIYPGELYDFADKYWSHQQSADPHLEYLVQPPIKFTKFYKRCT